MRRAEDRRFAKACALSAIDLELPEATLRGRRPMDDAAAGDDASDFAPVILRALRQAAEESPARTRPWIFCPMAIGGHGDHSLILHVVARHRREIEARFRLAFYEDLPYAAWPGARRRGLARFRRLLGATGWSRRALTLGPAVDAKLRLIGLYESQHAAAAIRIQDFTPRLLLPAAPHEAVWIQAADQAS
jgi:hypothetical protein